MVGRTDILSASEGMLQMPLFAVFTEPLGGMEAVMATMDRHLAYQVRLEREGIMFGAGPFFADDGETWNGEGMIIIRAGSLEDAERIAEADPMHASGARRYRIRPWLLNEGALTLSVGFSTGRVAIR